MTTRDQGIAVVVLVAEVEVAAVLVRLDKIWFDRILLPFREEKTHSSTRLTGKTNASVAGR